MSTPAEAIQWLDEHVGQELNIVTTPTGASGPITPRKWRLPPPIDGVYDVGDGILLNVGQLTGMSIDHDSLRIDLGANVIRVIAQPPEETNR